jgi:arylsulfatase A-like enzyme
MKRIFFSFLLFISSLVFSTVAQTPPDRPNIVVILADDLGYGDVSFNGCPDFQTPNIDSIANNGVLCRNGYVTHPVCSPSRAALLTGRYQQRFGHENNSDDDATNPRLGAPMSELLLPRILKPAGYVCGVIGKWHLGSASNFHPLSRGFDEFFGFLGASSDYYDAAVIQNYTYLTETQYLTEAFTREATSFINRHAAERFFLYLAYNAVHAPFQEPPASYMDRVANISDPSRRKYAAMVTALDDGVGQVLQALQAQNLLDKTLIFFLSDNGGPPRSFIRNDPLRGYKFNVLEGGIHVPFAVQWTGRLAPSSTYNAPVSSLDIVATAAAVGGVPLPADRVYDGVNVLPYLAGKKGPLQRTLFWRWFGLGKDGPPGSVDTIWAVRSGPLKLVTERATVGQPPALYDVANDIGETQNLATTQPADVKSLKKLYKQWNAQLVPPLWQFGTDFPRSVVLAGDWNGFSKDDSTSPWKLRWISAPGLHGTPDSFNWFKNTIFVATSGGDTTPGRHSFALVGNSNYSTQWGGGPINIDDTTSVPFFSGSALGPTSSISLKDGFYYSFRIIDPVVNNWNGQNVRVNLKLAVMKTSAPPVSVSRSGQTPTAPTSDEPVVVSITISEPKSPEERIYVRWSTDFFITSNLVPAIGAGVNYAATIPGQPDGTAVHYSIVTSTVDLSPFVTSGVIDSLTLATTGAFKFVASSATADANTDSNANSYANSNRFADYCNRRKK